MTLRPMSWSGSSYTLRIARHWNAFFSLAGLCEITKANKTVMLETGVAMQMQEVYQVVEQARPMFSSSDAWYYWQRDLCDHYGDHLVLKRLRPGNPFWEIQGSYFRDPIRAMRSAAGQPEFIGSPDWGLR